MTDHENKIYSEIAKANGILGSEIAAHLGLEKRIVNSMLAKSTLLKALVKQESNYKWYLLSKKIPTAGPDIPKPDKDLQNICNYYLNCLSLESSSSVSQFLTSKFALQYALLDGLKVDANIDKEAISLLNKINGNKNSKAYLGYPVRIYSIFGKEGTEYKKIAPIFLFPVEYSGGQVNISWIPSVNMDVLKAYNAENSIDSLTVELVNLETELGMNIPDAEIEKEDLVLRLIKIRQWDWAESIDPYNIPKTEDLTSFSNGIYNRPIIIETEKEKFTQGLEAELMALANMPEENYKDTALYSWIKDDFSSQTPENIKPILEVLPLNMEQAQSVQTALTSDLTIVTGPPGTGKSQVVTDLLLNIAWNGRSALFSSKNNKAVDVVDFRVNGLCKRPVLLRIGSNQYASRLAEIIEGLLSARPNSSDKTDMEFYIGEYDRINNETNLLKTQKDSIINARNILDNLEQKYCTVRNLIEGFFDSFDASDIGKIKAQATSFKEAYLHAIKENNGFFSRLFWSIVGKKKTEERDRCVDAYNGFAAKYKLDKASADMTLYEIDMLCTKAEAFEIALTITDEYKKALHKFTDNISLEDIDKKLMVNKEQLADVAYKLWDKWLLSQTAEFTPLQRKEMSDFVAAMRLAGDVDLAQHPELKKFFTKMSQEMTKYLQCWAVTSLSAKSRVPFTAGLFDYVIIDEASQCDIASVLPLLFRAKRAVIIGDPKQLSHISQLSRQQDLALLQRYKVSPSWSYSVNSVYMLASGKVKASDIVQLKDHFRSCSDIIEFSNDVFYDGNLRTATNYQRLKTPAGEKPGIRWININGKTLRPNSGSAFNVEEAAAVIVELKRLITIGYAGSIGVTTPFRRQATEIKEQLEKTEPKLYETLLRNHEFIADTVHKFQGDERDLMIFSPVVSNGAASGAIGFLSKTGNLFNVAITRARAVLVIVGNYSYCQDCTVDYLKKFAEYYGRLTGGVDKRKKVVLNHSVREYPWVANPEQVSEWEKVFYSVLYDSGIQTIPQYPVDKYKLDLAIILDDGRMLDIEVDGEMYHRSWNGELCYRDQLRNQRMFELGWDVKRFWVYQIRDDMQNCIEQIMLWCNSAK
ncbi:MAG: AAA domain-containing protein [Firmicutes bacterium]|nr:AAA domain-containing protein [Bacillota bacterium]